MKIVRDQFSTQIQLVKKGLETITSSPSIVDVYLDPMVQATDRYQINTINRVAAFLGQCAIETRNFTRFEENLYYTTPARIEKIFSKARGRGSELARNPEKLANVVYSGRLGNGSEASGDGWKYRGSGIIQLTGKWNYEQASKGIGIDLAENPDLVRTDPYVSCLAAAWFFDTEGCNELADTWQITRITETVNGPAKMHLSERISMSNRIKRALE